MAFGANLELSPSNLPCPQQPPLRGRSAQCAREKTTGRGKHTARDREQRGLTLGHGLMSREEPVPHFRSTRVGAASLIPATKLPAMHVTTPPRITAAITVMPRITATNIMSNKEILKLLLMVIQVQCAPFH